MSAPPAARRTSCRMRPHWPKWVLLQIMLTRKWFHLSVTLVSFISSIVSSKLFGIQSGRWARYLANQQGKCFSRLYRIVLIIACFGGHSFFMNIIIFLSPIMSQTISLGFFSNYLFIFFHFDSSWEQRSFRHYETNCGAKRRRRRGKRRRKRRKRRRKRRSGGGGTPHPPPPPPPPPTTTTARTTTTPKRRRRRRKRRTRRRKRSTGSSTDRVTSLTNDNVKYIMIP